MLLSNYAVDDVQEDLRKVPVHLRRDIRPLIWFPKGRLTKWFTSGTSINREGRIFRSLAMWSAYCLRAMKLAQWHGQILRPGKIQVTGTLGKILFTQASSYKAHWAIVSITRAMGSESLVMKVR